MEQQKCKMCGCTNNKACIGGCAWVRYDLCSECISALPMAEREVEERTPEQLKERIK